MRVCCALCTCMRVCVHVRDVCAHTRVCLNACKFVYGVHVCDVCACVCVCECVCE